MPSLRAILIIACALVLSAPAAAFAQANWERSGRLCAEYAGKEALPHCERAISDMPDSAPAASRAQVFLHMGIALGEEQRYEESLKYLKQAEKLDPKNAKIQYNLGVTYAALGRHTKALYAYRKATHLDENMLLAWGNRAVESYNTDRYYEAVTSFDCAMKIDPGYLDTRPEQQEMYDYSVSRRPKSVQMRREIGIRFTPDIGYLYPVGSDFKAERFIYLMLDGGVDVQLYGGWFATGYFTYAHTKWESASQGGGIDIYAPTFGIKYQRMAEDFEPHEARFFLDKSRYWFGVAVGPYITNASAAAVPVGGPFSTSRNSVDIGANATAGFDYYFYPNVGAGVNLKFHFVNFDENYFIFSGGPHIVGRF